MTSGMWYRAALTREQVAEGHVELARRLFADAISESPDPGGACLFVTSHDAATNTGGVHEEATDVDRIDAEALFFSPQSISAVPHLIAHYGAEPSEPPERSRASLLVGDEQDWDLLRHSSH